MASFAYEISYLTDTDETVTESGIVVGNTESKAIDNLFDLYGDSKNFEKLIIKPLNPDHKVFIFPKEVMDKFMEEYIW